MARSTKSERVPKPMQETFNAIVTLTDAFCRAHLDKEYAQLARHATAALCRKRPSPLATGNLKTWACGIVYALGSANFLFDKSQTPTMRAADLCAGFGVSQSTGSAKAKVVRDALGMGQMDPQWYRPSKMEDNPLAWMIMVNGFAVDVRQMPREVQEIAYEKGLIPYLPGYKVRMEGHRWSTLDSSGGRGAKAEAIDCTWSSANAPNLVCFQHVLRVRALVNFSGILVYQILQKASDEGTLFWATGSHEIMVFAITDKVKEQLIEIPCVGLCHGIERDPHQRWEIVQKAF